MTFDQLRCFLAAAEYLNITKAADVLFLSHSAVSRNIGNLEKSLGAKLINRNSKGIQLTPLGVFLQNNASQIMDQLSELEYAIQTAREKPEVLTVYSVGCYDKILMHTINEFCAQYSQVLFSLRNEQFVNVYDRVYQRYADVGFTYSFAVPPDIDASINCIPLQSEQFCVLISENHPFACQNHVTLEQLRKVRVLAHDQIADSVTGVYYTHLFLRDLDMRSGLNSFHINKMSSRNLEDMIFAVRAGCGAALLPHSLAVANSVGCKVLAIEDLDVPYNLLMLYREDNNSILNTFALHIRHAFNLPA